uniref:Polyserase-2 n=1 Tax=Phascolarctos cinereus TaxID=38626 RepID=A0A6P5M0J0_PHACI|nr:polyserase-2 [Phascolarctos cinereus]
MLPALYPTPGKTQDLECGRSRPQPRVVGGSDAMLGDWPWQVSLHKYGMQICGGSLITESWVISAAHCVVENGTVSPPEEFLVVLGLYSLDLIQYQGQYRNITEILIPSNYTMPHLGSDIALLRLAEPANLTESVQTICLPQANHHFPQGASCWATGWGDIQEKEWLPSPQLLQEVELRIVGESTCQCLLNSNGPFNETVQLLPGMLCAGFKEGKKDTCQGDSGGPLVCEEAGQWFLAGITSFGHGCARRNRPGIFTAVAAYEDWIRERVSGASFPEQPEPVTPDMPEEPPNNCTLALPQCGSAPRPGYWPWKAIIVAPRSNPCHGVMVSENWVLAPASCLLGLQDLNISNWEVILPNAKSVPVIQVTLNNNHTLHYGYDLALVKLEVSVNLTEETRPVCLPQSYHYFVPGGHCHLAQWGPGVPLSVNNSLLEAEMMTAWWCYCLHGEELEEVPIPGMNPRILCADYQEEEKSSCWFGSCWSLLCQESGTWFLAGVSAPTDSCLRPRVFSPVQLHDHWMRHVTLTAYLEDQLAWNWGTVVDERLCPPKADYGACGLRPEVWEKSNPWPWMSEVHGTRGGACIGSLVSPGWVLAATHCVSRMDRKQKSQEQLRLLYPKIERREDPFAGLHSSRSSGLPGCNRVRTHCQVSRSVISIRSPNSMGSNHSNTSLVLLKLETKVESSPSALPVCLHSGPAPTETSCWVLGWKDISNRVPLAVPVSILSPERCHCFCKKNALPSGTICVQYSKEIEDRPEMDSGSSLLCQEETGVWVLVGLSLKGSQQLFAPVGTQYSWISQIVEEASFMTQFRFSPVLEETSGLCPPDLSSSAILPKAALLLFLPLFLLLRL